MRRIDRNSYLPQILLLSVIFATLLTTGCKPFEKRVPALQPLKPLRMTPKSVSLDMFFVRFPLGDKEINGPFWDEIDEQKIDPETRQKLVENGFRTGVISGPLPTRFSQILDLSGKTQVDSLNEGDTTIVDLQKAPTIERRHLQLRSGRRGEIMAQAVLPELSVILRDSDGTISGGPLYLAQPMFAVHTINLPDGRVRLRLTPEIQHGQDRRKFTNKQNGMFKLDIGRERKSYEDLEIETDLKLGDFIVLSNIPIREGSLGSHFFNETTEDGRCQKLLIIRLSQTQHDDQFE